MLAHKLTLTSAICVKVLFESVIAKGSRKKTKPHRFTSLIQ